MAIVVGLLLVNTIKPGEGLPSETIDELTKIYASDSDITSSIYIVENSSEHYR